MSETLSVFGTGIVAERINSLALQVDYDGNGQIDDKEAALFYKAALDVKGLTEDDRHLIASFASKQMMSKNKAVPVNDLTACLTSIFSSKDDSNAALALSELEISFNNLSVNLPPPEFKVSDEQIQNRITKFVKLF